MVSIKAILSSIVSLIAFPLTFYSVAKLMCFLSRPVHVLTTREQILLDKLLEDERIRKDVFLSLTIDSILIIVFVLQHSLMKTDWVKNVWTKCGLDVAGRSLYNLSTSFLILFLIGNWKRTPTVTLWNIDLNNSTVLWWTFTLVHVFAWSVIYGGSLLMDLAELVGIKQVYYEGKNLNSPMAYKSPELRRLYSHARHPSFTGISIVLWVTNCMSLDRLILATLWTIYMYVAWNTEPKDVAYQKNQLVKKKYELRTMLK